VGNDPQLKSLRSTDFAAGADLVVVRGRDERVRGLDPASGELRWTQLDPAVDGARAQTGPAVDGEVAYFGARTGRVYGLDRGSGARRWEYATPNGQLAAMAAAAGLVYVASAHEVVAVQGAGG
jgi:outer membrane protein assembly factor BamB